MLNYLYDSEDMATKIGQIIGSILAAATWTSLLVLLLWQMLTGT